MTISSLPETTARVLTSTQALHTATSVVKELVDNALDAHATSIAVEITANTLDKISVKDDGSGIGVDDRLLLCKRGYTSKITDLEDLAKLGGTFLGFRGTALASIAELSKDVTIITKVDGEQPATTLTFGPSGKLLSSASASHNVGTTVRVHDFLAAVPVRRQEVLKNPSKAQDHIKKLLQSYALARPSVKLSLRVLKAKNDKANWSYAASRGESQLLAAAAQIVGKPVASSCQLHNTSLTGEGACATDFHINALLLGSGAEGVSNGGGVGQYISIDGRPVDQEKGVTKELVRLYKSHLRYASGLNTPVPSKPFLVVHVRCPERSYDVNIEPAKDVVLFHDESKLLDLAKKLFVKAYGELDVGDDTDQRPWVDKVERQGISSFDVLLARKKPALETEPTSHVDPATDEWETTVSAPDSLTDSFARSMKQPPSSLSAQHAHHHKTDHAHLSTTDFFSPHRGLSAFDQGPTLGESTRPSEDILTAIEVYDSSSAVLNNPFVRAKVHVLQIPKSSPLSTNKDLARRSDETGISSISSPPSTTSSSVTSHQKVQGSTSHLPSPHPSPIDSAPYQNPGPPVPRRSKWVHDDEGGRPDPDGSSPVARLIQRRQNLLGSSIKSSNSADSPSGFRKASAISNQHIHGRERTSPPEQGTLVGKSLQSNLQSAITNKPYRSPVRVRLDKTSGAAPTDPSGNLSPSLAGTASHTIDPDVSARHDADLRNILDFEERKRAVNQQRKLQQGRSSLPSPRSFVRTQTSLERFIPPSATARTPVSNNADEEPALPNPTPTPAPFPGLSARPNETPSHGRDHNHPSNPHRNRYLAAVRNLSSPETTRTTRRLHIPDADVTHPQLDPQTSARKPKRAVSSKLPLETIPPDCVKHDLLVTPAAPFPPTESLLACSRALSAVDPYVRTGGVEVARMLPADRDVARWQTSLEALVAAQYSLDADGATELTGFAIPLAEALKTCIESVSGDDS